MGYAFESICYKQIGEIRKALNINAGSTIGVWRYSPRKSSNESGVQIDLVFDRNDGITTLCEIKFTNKRFVIDKNYAENLLRKVEVYKEQTRTKKQLYIAFISASGIKENKYSKELVNGVVTLDDLFKDVS